MIAERVQFVVAREYGVDPDSVLQWSDYTFKRAILYMVVDSNESKVTADDVEERRRQRMANNPTGELLGVSINHFAQFVEHGELNVMKLTTKGGYAEHQVAYIREELTKAGMLESVQDTAPLPEDVE